MAQIRESAFNALTPREPGRMLVQIITPGVGSSGVYSEATLREAAANRVFAAGTQMFADHPSQTEAMDRPERSIKDLAGVLTSDAYWDGTALVAEAKTFDPWKSIIAEMHDAIGVSIRASGTVNEHDAEGRPVIASLDEALSVDFVTKAGRGGAIRELYESARPAVEALPGDLVAGDLESRLEQALGAGRMLHDFTDEWVVYAEYKNEERVLYRQTYTATDTTVTLTGTPERVVRRTTYDSPNPPSSPVGAVQESKKETAMELTESQYKALTEKADRVEALEAEREQFKTERDQARQALAEAVKAADAEAIEHVLEAAGVEFTKWETSGLKADIPTLESGRVDIDAFKARVAEAAAEKTPAGTPKGLGATVTESTDMTDAELREALGIK